MGWGSKVTLPQDWGEGIDPVELEDGTFFMADYRDDPENPKIFLKAKGIVVDFTGFVWTDFSGFRRKDGMNARWVVLPKGTKIEHVVGSSN